MELFFIKTIVLFFFGVLAGLLCVVLFNFLTDVFPIFFKRLLWPFGIWKLQPVKPKWRVLNKKVCKDIELVTGKGNKTIVLDNNTFVVVFWDEEGIIAAVSHNSLSDKFDKDVKYVPGGSK